MLIEKKDSINKLNILQFHNKFMYNYMYMQHNEIVISFSIM